MTTNLMRRALGATLAILFTLGAQAATESTNPNNLQLEDLPAPVQKTVREAAKGAVVRHMSRTPVSFTARIDFSGQKTELRVSETGKVLRSRTKQEAEALFEEEQRLAQAGKLNTVALQSVPQIAREKILEAAKGGRIDQVVKTPAVFSVVIEKDGKTDELRIADDGSVLAGSPP